MHTLATYSFSLELASSQEASDFLGTIHTNLNTWLKTKGATLENDGSGDFTSRNPDGAGSVVRESLTSPSGSYQRATLEELSGDSEIFSTTVYTTISDKTVNFHCSLQVEGLESGITRLRGTPKCPAIVRRIADLSSEWKLNGNVIPGPLTEIDGEAEGVLLAQEIINPDRRIPIVVVARTDSGNEVWPHTASELAYELFGLAKVYLASDEATYGLSDQESCANSIDCYNGAIRLYWPRTGQIVPSQLWTQHQLVSRDRDGRGKNRLKRDIKEFIMSAATISNPRPPLIAKIAAETRAIHISSLEASSGQVAVLEERAKALEAENSELTERLTEAEQSVFELTAKLKYQSTYQAPPSEHDSESSNDATYDFPDAGELRFYKKIADKGSHDLLRPFKDCGHNSWQHSASAHKARKGVEKLEGQSNWKGMWHCGSCTGGGVWKVQW